MFLKSLATGAMCLAAGTAAAADSAAGAPYPSQPIRLIVPFAPGGTTDIVARAISRRTGEALGQPLVVDNRGGGGGSIGAYEAARAKPDGYTLGVATVSTTATNPAIMPKLNYDPLTDFTPIINVAATPNVLAVHPSFAGRTLASLVAQAKARPGELAYATAGTGSIGHMLMEMMADKAGIRLTHIPYRGSGPALTDVVAGQAPMIFDNLPSALPFIESGKLVALAVAAPRRLPNLPDVPTFAEAGIPDVNRVAFYGLYGPKGLAPEVVAKVHAAVKQALSAPDVRKAIEGTGSQIVGNTPEAFAREIADENAFYRRVARERGIKGE